MFASYAVVPTKSEPQRLRWRDGPIRIAISSSLTQQNSNIKTDSDVIGAIRRSLELWQSVVDIEFAAELTDRQTVSLSGASRDGVSIITIAASPENVLLFSKNPYSESARTRVFYNRKGFINEADIVLNPYQQFSTDGTLGTFDLESTLAHEIGHLLGLRHSSVLGSIMFESVSRNGTTDVAEPQQRTLADADIAAVRELYGFDREGDDCCGAISGKLVQNSSRTAKNLRVWAEANDTGRVAAQTETAVDGSFRLGGLSVGVYSVFWQRGESEVPSTVGELGTVSIEKGDNKLLNDKVDVSRSGLALSYIGLNSQLADSAITIGSGREYVVYLGGKDLDMQRLQVEFNSPFFRAIPGSIKKYDFGDDLSAVSFVLAVDPNVQPGVYSLFVTDNAGILAALIGGLKVNGPARQQP